MTALSVAALQPAPLNQTLPRTQAEWQQLLNQLATWQAILQSVQAGQISADRGDAAATLTVGVSAPTQLWKTPLTAARAVTLSTTGAFNGAAFRIVRAASATGAFNLNVGTGPLKALTAGQWVDVQYAGITSGWIETASGSL